MPVLLTQMIALIGVVVGAIATLGSTILLERIKWSRSQSVRWDEKKLQAYADYARAVKSIHQLAFRLSAAKRTDSQAVPVDKDVALAQLAEAETVRTNTWEAVLLLGDSATISAAYEWRLAVGQLTLWVRDLSSDDVGWADLVRVVDEARDKFYLAARRSMSVGGDYSPQAQVLTRQKSRLGGREAGSSSSLAPPEPSGGSTPAG